MPCPVSVRQNEEFRFFSPPSFSFSLTTAVHQRHSILSKSHYTLELCQVGAESIRSGTIAHQPTLLSSATPYLRLPQKQRLGSGSAAFCYGTGLSENPEEHSSSQESAQTWEIKTRGITGGSDFLVKGISISLMKHLCSFWLKKTQWFHIYTHILPDQTLQIASQNLIPLTSPSTRCLSPPSGEQR